MMIKGHTMKKIICFFAFIFLQAGIARSQTSDCDCGSSLYRDAGFNDVMSILPCVSDEDVEYFLAINNVINHGPVTVCSRNGVAYWSFSQSIEDEALNCNKDILSAKDFLIFDDKIIIEYSMQGYACIPSDSISQLFGSESYPVGTSLPPQMKLVREDIIAVEVPFRRGLPTITSFCSPNFQGFKFLGILNKSAKSTFNGYDFCFSEKLEQLNFFEKINVDPTSILNHEWKISNNFDYIENWDRVCLCLDGQGSMTGNGKLAIKIITSPDLNWLDVDQFEDGEMNSYPLDPVIIIDLTNYTVQIY